MRKIALFALLTLPLFSNFFPQQIHTTIKAIEGKSVKLNTNFPVDGMSGVIIHSYANELEAITSRVVQKNAATAALIHTDIIHHDELPTIKTTVKTGDRVIGGYLYNNVLLLAPDAETYAKITSQHNKNWIHPDLFALYLSSIGDGAPNKENLASFAKAYQVGLIYIISKDTGRLLDPISGKVIAKKTLSGLPSKGKVPFFMRFDEIDSGWFGSSAKGNYYQIMGNI